MILQGAMNMCPWKASQQRPVGEGLFQRISDGLLFQKLRAFNAHWQMFAFFALPFENKEIVYQTLNEPECFR